MPTTTFVFLDTNILFRYVTQGKPGCEPENWKRLNELIEGSKGRPLVPEVVELEFEKLVSGLDDDYALNFGKLEKYITSLTFEAKEKSKDKDKVWNELGDFFTLIRDQFAEWKQKKIEGSKQRVKEIEGWLRSAHVIKPPFDSDILFRARRRMLAGRLVDQEKRPEADCCIIESLAKFFVGREDGDQLLFCTENSQDFAVEVHNKLSLHTVMKPGLPPTEVFTNLASPVAFLKGNKAVEEPAPEKVKEAVEREKAKEIEREIELEEAVLEAMTPNQSLPLGSQDMADAIRAIRLAGAIDPSYVRAVTPDMSHIRAAQEAVARMMEPFRQQQEAVARVMEPFRQQQEAVARMMEPFRQQQEAVAKMIEPLRQQQEAVAKMMEPLRQQLEALSNVMASLSERIGPAGACGAGL